ncbi:MAG: histidine kinase [Pseudonocardia sp.]|nr:histidine kinase [Pseudonocardia sp.]
MFDVMLVCAVLLVIVLMLWPYTRQYGPGGMILQSVMALVLLLRRVMPLTVLLVMLLSTIVLFVIGHFASDMLAGTVDIKGAWVVLALPFAEYSAAVYGSDRRKVWLLTGAILVIAARPLTPTVDLAIGACFVSVLPALLGTYVANLNERVERAERDQHRLAEQARVEERVRLAAEMHDVVTHRVSLMVLQAGALAVTALDEPTRAAAEDLRAAGCQALEELRDLVGVLRSAPDEADEAPGRADVLRAGGQATAEDFAELVAESESIGVSVRLDQSGNPAHASPIVGRTAYRIVQEALTNVRKHAPGAQATITVRYGADRVELAIRNTASRWRADPELTGTGSQTGLLGLRHRVELVSGTLRAGPTDDGGFEVAAVLPAYVPTREDPTGGSARLERAEVVSQTRERR